MGKNLQIIAYITADENRVLGGDPLTLLIKDVMEQKQTSVDIAKALRADIIQLKNGDYMLVKE